MEYEYSVVTEAIAVFLKKRGSDSPSGPASQNIRYLRISSYNRPMLPTGSSSVLSSVVLRLPAD